MTKPIKPSEVADLKTHSIPSEVFEVFNRLIAANWNGTSSTVKQENVVTSLINYWASLRRGPLERSRIFAENWLDIEDSYRKAGWKVEYDKPGYNETYDANWTFRKK